MKSTNGGDLNQIKDCWLKIPNAKPIIMKNLPDISDSKSAVYNSENIMGRSVPLYTYSHSGDRTISLQLHFFIVRDSDASDNLNYLRSIQSCCYPREGLYGAPYTPPIICTLSCGKLLSVDQPLCVALQSYSVKFPTEVAWYEKDGTYCPYRFDVDTTWLTVYSSDDLPYASRIITSGR